MRFIDKQRPAFSLVALAVLAAIAVILLTAGRTQGQWKKPDSNNAYYNGEKVVLGSSHRGSKVDVSGSGFFTDFSDTINSTVSSGTIFNNSTTSTNGGFFHLGTTNMDAYWGAASSSGGNPFSSSEVANNALYFGNRDNVALQLLTAAAVRMTITGGGNVGIGSTAPNERFVIQGSNIRPIIGDSPTHTQLYGSYNGQTWNALEVFTNGGNAAGLSLTNNVNSGTTGVISFANKAAGTEGTDDLRLGLIASGTDGAANSGNFQIYTMNNGSVGERIRIDKAGNVGIGTTGPGHKLEVNGNISLGGAGTGNSFFAYYNSASNYAGFNATGGGNLQFLTGTSAPAVRLTLDTAGNVGIGTTGPGHKLEVNGNISLGGAGTGNSFFAYYNSASNYAGFNATGGGNLQFFTGTSSPAVRFTLDTAGKVGIGTASPTEKLTVSGNIKVNALGQEPGNITAEGTIEAGNIKARYQDVAEWVESSEQLPAGTVVVLDSTKSNQVIASSQSYDTRVAGVISAQPGIALGEKSDSKVLVATTGRVRVKVDASKGPIHIGDLLVTSDVPGVAMKSEPVEFAGRKMHMPGTLIGKALEPLEKGSGEVLVLLSLQ